MIVQGVSWIGTLTGILGTFLITRKHKGGFYFWSFSNFCWIWVGWKTQMPAQIFLMLVYLAMNIYGLWQWKKPEVIHAGKD